MFTQSVKFHIPFIVTYYGVQMFEKGDSSNRQKMKGCFFQQVLRQICLNTGKHFSVEVSFPRQQKRA